MKIPVAIQGIKGSYSEEAARRFFGVKAEIIECLSFEDTFQSVISQKTKFAVVPLKNKIVGEITSATEFLNRTNLKISDELPLEVRHVLCGTKDAKYEFLKTVRSHIEALKQCRNIFECQSLFRTNHRRRHGFEHSANRRRKSTGKRGNRKPTGGGNLRGKNLKRKYRRRFGQLDDVLSFGKLIKK